MLRLLGTLLLTPVVPIVWFMMVWGIGFYDAELFWIASGVSFLLYISVWAISWHLWKDQCKTRRSVVNSLWIRPTYIPSDEDELNKLLALLWPHIGNVLKNILTNNIQAVIQKSSAMLSKFQFTDIDIGNISPEISDVKIYGDINIVQKEIILDVDFKLKSNCNIEVKMNRLKAGICDFSIEGVLRIVLAPLLEDLPLIGAITIAFVEAPNISYDLTSLANLFDFPGFDKILQYAVGQVVKSTIVLPERVCIQLDRNISLSQIKYPMPQGVVRITIFGGHHLQVPNRNLWSRKFMGMRSPISPYVVVKVGSEQNTTKPQSGSDHPIWNESFNFHIFDVPCTKIEVSVHDDDSIVRKDSWIASVTLPASTIEERGVIDKVVSIGKHTKSKLHVCLEWYQLSNSIADLKEAARLVRTSNFKYQAILNIFATGAANLPQHDGSLPINPVLRIQVSPEEQYKTTVALRTNNPKWRENFRVYLTNPETTPILFEVSDSTTKDILGTLTFSVKKLVIANDMTIESDFPLKNSVADSTLRLRMVLRILKPKPKFSPAKSDNSEFIINKLPSSPKNRESVIFTVRKASAPTSEKAKND